MAFLFYLSLALLVASIVAVVFVRANPSSLAAGLRMAAPILLGAFGIALTLIGRGGLGLPLVGFAAVLLTRELRRRRAKPSPSGKSSVRTAALEMELDHDSGAMNGLVLAGTLEGRLLDDLNEADLKRLYRELQPDNESLALFEAYLDRRSPGWRDDFQADDGAGLGSAPGTGAMTEQEAYQLLGLDAGASAAQIREAHRRLMKRVHPDTGGSVFLAARINEAKDFLLKRHG